MSELRLELHPDAYELRLDGKLLARLEGGPAALLAGAGARLRDLDIEVAIERAEEWLMPAIRSFQGDEMRVGDDTGRIRMNLGDPSSLTTADVERLFTRAFDDVAFGRAIDRDGVADIVLLRELAHHARLSRVSVAPGG